jgi:hypothetical protein
VGVGVGVGVEVATGVKVAVGARVSLGRGVIAGVGGVLTHAVNPISNRMSHDQGENFTARTTTSNCVFLTFQGRLRPE